ncbi:Hypothetical predicted protein [Mytilus galloprovincialis]|uniref:CCHC-type domain-containing protein n=1 Tax=Mytilus galloprovincialis TaxID=29158 RepID=A0A8B6FPH3_MYTGA|nr:Hypothetical predicted protein [Mytilus galloprovincialis]
MEASPDRDASDTEEQEPRQNSDQRETDKSLADSSAFAAMDLFKTYLDNKLHSLKRELKEDTANTTDEVVKKIKTEHSYEFKYNGNKAQFDFNSEIDSEIKKIKRAAEHDDYRKIKDICYTIGIRLQRNKCIKIADKSPAGWDTVKEYLSDELASDSEDEKKIRYAENRALRAKKFRKQKTSKKPGNSATLKSTEPPRVAPVATATSANVGGNFRAQRSNYGPSATDFCFSCQEQGHWRRNCPKIIKAAHGQQ